MNYMVLLRSEHDGKLTYIALDNEDSILTYSKIEEAEAKKYSFEQELDYDPDFEEVQIIGIMELASNLEVKKT